MGSTQVDPNWYQRWHKIWITPSWPKLGQPQLTLIESPQADRHWHHPKLINQNKIGITPSWPKLESPLIGHPNPRWLPMLTKIGIPPSWSKLGSPTGSLATGKRSRNPGQFRDTFETKISQSDQGYEKLRNTGTFPGHFLTRVPWTLHFPGQFRDPIHSEYLVSNECLEISITFEPLDRFSKFKRLNNQEFHQDPEFRDKFGTYIEKSRISGFIPNFGTTKDPDHPKLIQIGITPILPELGSPKLFTPTQVGC